MNKRTRDRALKKAMIGGTFRPDIFAHEAQRQRNIGDAPAAPHLHAEAVSATSAFSTDQHIQVTQSREEELLAQEIADAQKRAEERQRKIKELLAEYRDAWNRFAAEHSERRLLNSLPSIPLHALITESDLQSATNPEKVSITQSDRKAKAPSLGTYSRFIVTEFMDTVEQAKTSDEYLKNIQADLMQETQFTNESITERHRIVRELKLMPFGERGMVFWSAYDRGHNSFLDETIFQQLCLLADIGFQYLVVEHRDLSDVLFDQLVANPSIKIEYLENMSEEEYTNHYFPLAQRNAFSTGIVIHLR